MSAIDPVTIAKARAMCIVGDRNHVDGLTEMCSLLGGAWLEGLNAWKTQEKLQHLQCIGLLADKPARIKHRAPLLLFAQSTVELATAMRHTCAQLDDVTCMWVRLLDGPATEIVNEIVLGYAATGGMHEL